MSYVAVKSSLGQFCKDDYLKTKINDVVFNSNKIIFEAYCYANLHVLECLEKRREIPLLNQSFFQKCCAIVSTFKTKKEMEAKDKTLVETFNLYNSLRPSNYDIAYRDSITIILTYIAKDMEIATTNHLTLNFYKRFSKFLKLKYPDLTNNERYEVCKGIYEKQYKGNNPLVVEYRQKLGDVPPYENNIKKNSSCVVNMYYEILQLLIEKKQRLFSLLPHKKGFQMSYITIDKSVLRDLIIENKKANKQKGLLNLRKDIEANPRQYFERFFNIKKHETPTRQFTMFKTDGKAVSVILEIPERVAKATKQQDFGDYDYTIGIDPGLRFTFVGYDSKDEIIKYSGKQYYHSSGVNETNYKQQRCYGRSKEFLDYKANMPSPKTTDVKKLQCYITYSLKGLDNALRLHYDNPFRKWKFKTFIKKQKTFHKICQKITKKEHINDTSIKPIVGFGDWSNPRDCIIRGHKRGPVKEIKKDLKRWCMVVDVDEFRTSKCCSCCHHATSKVKFDGKEINSVLRCSNNECGITVDRDINGSKNIYMLFSKMLKGEQRPKAFCR
jgi:hypothetical protein